MYVWGLSTGHLDRIETGAVALSLISGCKTLSEGEHCKLEITNSADTARLSTGLSVVPFRFSQTDNLSHMILFDTELLLHLLTQLQTNIFTNGKFLLFIGVYNDIVLKIEFFQIFNTLSKFDVN